MSRPFALALLGVVAFVALLAFGAWTGSKGAVPLALVLGGALMLGGATVGVLREVVTGRK